MFQVVIGDLSRGDRNAPQGIAPGSLASIASGSNLDQVIVDGRVLGIGAVVQIGPSSLLSCKDRSRMSDAEGAFASIRDANGDVIQVHDTAELCIWAPGEVPVVPARRANRVVSASIPFGDIPSVPFSELVGYRAMREGCAGRQWLTIWVGQPDLNSDGQVDLRLRLRRAGLWQDSAGGAGSSPNMLREVGVPMALAQSALYGEVGVCTPQTFDVTGAAEFEIYMAENTASDGFWLLSVELEDPR